MPSIGEMLFDSFSIAWKHDLCSEVFEIANSWFDLIVLDDDNFLCNYPLMRVVPYSTKERFLCCECCLS